MFLACAGCGRIGFDVGFQSGSDVGYFMSPTGNDANPGTRDQPWLTFAGALPRLVPGDTSWYHVHAEPVLYITLSASAQRTQNLGEDWGRGRGEGGAPPAAAVRTGPAIRALRIDPARAVRGND